VVNINEAIITTAESRLEENGNEARIPGNLGRSVAWQVDGGWDERAEYPAVQPVCRSLPWLLRQQRSSGTTTECVQKPNARGTDIVHGTHCATRAMYLRSAGSKDGAVTVGPVRNFVIIDRAKERHARDGRAALGPGRR
jgi:hypothetical protein